MSGPPFIPTPHLWFILTDPDPKTGKVVAVLLVTPRPHTDKTVTLLPGEHEFIQHDSNVDFSSTLLVATGRLHDCIQAGTCRQQPDMTPVLLRKLRVGLLQSPRTIHDIIAYCNERFDAAGYDLLAD